MNIEDLKKKYKGYLYTDKNSSDLTPKFHKTPFPSFNEASMGGLPRGRVVHMYAEKSCGKTSLALAFVQNCKGKIGFVDMEGTMTFEYISKIIDIPEERVMIIKAFDLESGLEAMGDLMEFGCEFVIIDSIGGSKVKSTIEKEGRGEIGHQQIASTARVLSNSMSIITDKAFVTGATCIFLNQLRIDPAKAGPYSDGAVPSGGKTIPFESTLEIRLTAAKDVVTIGKDKVEKGVNITLNIDKNKLGAKGRKCKIYYEHLEGFDPDKDYFNRAVKLNIIKKAGSWYSYKDLKLGQGAPNAMETLRDNLELWEEIKELSKEKPANYIYDEE